MPEKCQFEEDCFQQQVDAAIARLTNIVTTPGRVTENILGYDGAYFIPPDKVFSVVGLNVLPSPPSTPTSGNLGITVNPTVWKDLAKLDPAKIPKFRLNLFIQ